MGREQDASRRKAVAENPKRPEEHLIFHLLQLDPCDPAPRPSDPHAGLAHPRPLGVSVLGVVALLCGVTGEMSVMGPVRDVLLPGTRVPAERRPRWPPHPGRWALGRSAAHVFQLISRDEGHSAQLTPACLGFKGRQL